MVDIMYLIDVGNCNVNVFLFFVSKGLNKTQIFTAKKLLIYLVTWHHYMLELLMAFENCSNFYNLYSFFKNIVVIFFLDFLYSESSSLVKHPD